MDKAFLVLPQLYRHSAVVLLLVLLFGDHGMLTLTAYNSTVVMPRPDVTETVISLWVDWCHQCALLTTRNAQNHVLVPADFCPAVFNSL